jgi:hypothetical protein
MATPATTPIVTSATPSETEGSGTRERTHQKLATGRDESRRSTRTSLKLRSIEW